MNKTGTLQTETTEVLRAESARLHALAVAFILANVVDILLTQQLLSAGGVELNPVMQFVINSGFAQALVWKFAISAAVASVLAWRRKTTTLGVLTSVTVMVCIWNAIGLVGGTP